MPTSTSPTLDVVRISDLNPARWQARWRCHQSLQRCQHVDRPNDNQGVTWVDKLSFLMSGADPDDYGMARGAWWDRSRFARRRRPHR